ncbi:hypothetical protein QKW35_06070 [Pontibacterium granulatum]|uniref:hypothetical protein n=1 Tax=Pontibacterium granulatum TaxID=2036029 RepID=UPI002499D2D4|nr:hypothetical protein [Pontibacterium granulatum]MDI3323935.1 hypothetical protein [Pontibacterium granulatum]
MTRLDLKYQAQAFVNCEEIEPNAENVKRLLDVFGEYGWIPTTFREKSESGGPDILRPRLNSVDDEWSLFIGMSRVFVVKNCTDVDCSNMGSLVDFSNKARDVFERLFAEYDMSAKRVALNVTSLFDGVPEERLAEFWQNFVSVPDFYEAPISDYGVKINSVSECSVGGFNESLNSISVVNEAEGTLEVAGSELNFKGVNIELDVNTLAENKKSRFDKDTIGDALRGVIQRGEVVSNGWGDLL